MSAITTVLCRVQGGAETAHLERRRADSLLAAYETELVEHLRRCGMKHVRRIVPAAPCDAASSPHFSAETEHRKAVFYVLSVSPVAKDAALTAAQSRYCENSQEADVYVLPCVVQHVRADVARCVAVAPVLLRQNGNWLLTPEVLQYLPLQKAYAAGIPMPCPAWLLRKSTMLREVANHGTRLYPGIAGFAHAKHLPPGVELYGSGMENPLLITLTAGRENGYLQLLYADFYSAANPVNELTVVDVQPGSVVGLVGGEQSMFCATCAELAMFPEHEWLGARFLWSLSMWCHHVQRVEPREQGSYDGATLRAKVESSRMADLCGMPVCYLKVNTGKLIFNVYTAVFDEDAPLPQPGDWVQVEGVLYAAPDALVAREEVGERHLPGPYASLMCESVALAVVAGGLLAAGYRLITPACLAFRRGQPELAFRGSDGRRLLVFVETIVNGVADSNGYSRYAPNSYPSVVQSAPPDGSPADVLFTTVSLNRAENAYRVSVEQHGAVLQELRFCNKVEMPNAEALSETTAARLFGEMMVTHRFDALLPLLSEEVHYKSETAGLSYRSKCDMLRHLRACLDQWRKRDELPNLKFLLSSVEWEGARRPCMVACQSGEIISATVFGINAGRIISVHSFAGEALDTLQAAE